MTPNPVQLIERSPMSRVQVIAVAITIMLNALDGFDVLSVSFAAPGIAREFEASHSLMGIVLAAELLGMGFGSVLAGNLADKKGRRPLLLLCLAVMGLGMLVTAFAQHIYMLLVLRVLTGLGIGGTLAVITAAAAEHSNNKNRGLCVALSAVGYPIGGVLGGTVASMMLAHYDWRSVFILGAVFTFIFLVLTLVGMPETVAHLCSRQTDNSLVRVNRLLKRMGHDEVDALPIVDDPRAKVPLAVLFTPEWITRTVLVSIAYAAHIATFYFLIKWLPSIVADKGFSPSMAGSVLVWANLGGAIGGVFAGIVCRYIPIRTTAISIMLISFIMVSAFGHVNSSFVILAISAAVTSFFSNGGVATLYAVFTEVFTTQVRAVGTGLAIGIGRAGAATSPILAGFLFDKGLGLSTVAMIMGSGALIGAASLILLGRAHYAAQGDLMVIAGKGNSKSMK